MSRSYQGPSASLTASTKAHSRAKNRMPMPYRDLLVTGLTSKKWTSFLPAFSVTGESDGQKRKKQEMDLLTNAADDGYCLAKIHLRISRRMHETRQKPVGEVHRDVACQQPAGRRYGHGKGSGYDTVRETGDFSKWLEESLVSGQIQWNLLTNLPTIVKSIRKFREIRKGRFIDVKTSSPRAPASVPSKSCQIRIQ